MNLEEGQNCPVCYSGVLGYEDVDGCTCHISPPCSQCIENPLVCLECGYNPEEDEAEL